MPIFRELARGDPEEKVWAFNYPQFLAVFKKALSDSQIREHTVPYQARYSGPSIDNARRYRTIEETHTRGQWKHAKPKQ
eukprot:3013553-Pyramimonas_sp.AAC.1